MTTKYKFNAHVIKCIIWALSKNLYLLNVACVYVRICWSLEVCWLFQFWICGSLEVSKFEWVCCASVEGWLKKLQIGRGESFHRMFFELLISFYQWFIWFSKCLTSSVLDLYKRLKPKKIRPLLFLTSILYRSRTKKVKHFENKINYWEKRSTNIVRPIY